MHAGEDVEGEETNGRARALLVAWLECPSIQSADALMAELRSDALQAAEGACRAVGLGVPCDELATSFWARVLLDERKGALMVDLLENFDATAALWMLETADHRVDQLASSNAERGSEAWIAQQQVQEDPATLPAMEDVMACIALHSLNRQDRSLLVQVNVYGDAPSQLGIPTGIEPGRESAALDAAQTRFERAYARLKREDDA